MINRILTLTLVFQIIFQPLASMGYSEVPRPVASPRPSVVKNHPLFSDPLLEELKQKGDSIPLELGLSATDPGLDEDPFFLRGQHWTDEISSTNNSLYGNSIHVDVTVKNVQIHVPAVRSTLVIEQPLSLIAMTDEFIYFAAKPEFRGFEQKSIGLGGVGEGIFVVAVEDILSRASKAFGPQISVPIFFLPLPEGGWKGAVGTYMSKSDILAIFDSNDEILPIPVSQVREVVRAERFNLFLAQAYTLKFEPEPNTMDLRAIPPAPKITAGFGILFTGINTFDLEQSLFAQQEDSKFKNQVDAILRTLQECVSLPKAEAAEFHLDPHLQGRLVRVGIVVSIAVVASVALKFTAFRKYFREKHKGDVEHSLKRSLINQGIDMGDVFAHTLTTFSQVSSVWFANTVEFLGDRYFPLLSSADNTLVRTLLNKTVFWVRKTNDKVPVSAKTWTFGSVILGGIDTIFVAVQLYAVVPALSRVISGYIPALQSRVDDAFDVSNPNTPTMNQNGVIGNAVAYITVGASDFSQGLQAQLSEKAENAVKEKMRRDGVDPENPAHAADFKRNVDEYLNREMQKMGVPSKEDFLFDANSIYEGAVRLLGYDRPRAAIDGFSPRGVGRPGLVMSSIKESLRRLETLVSMNPIGIQSPHRSEAIELLTLFSKDVNLLKSFVQVPFKALFCDEGYLKCLKKTAGRVRSVRQSFMLLTHEGSFEDVQSYLPAEWKKFHPEAIRLAAKTYSESFSDFINGEQNETKYTPPVRDRVTVDQETRAIRVASETFLNEKGFAFNTVTATEEEGRLFKRLYIGALNSHIGLHPDFHEDPSIADAIETKARSETQSEINRPEVQQYLGSLASEQRFQFVASLEAANYVKAYKDAVATNPAFSPLSMAQPGRFQALRQKPMIRRSEFLTRMVRAAESVFAGDQIGTGRTARLDRNVPFWYDFKQSNKRAYAGAITRATAGYWFSYLVWGLNLPADLWALGLVASFTVGAPAQALTRFFNYQGAKPMGKVSMMALFAFIYTWATFWGAIPEQIFAGDFKNIFHYVVNQHPLESIGIAAAVLAITKNADAIKDQSAKTAHSLREKWKSAVNSCSLIFNSSK